MLDGQSTQDGGFEACLKTVLGDQNPRVWSLIISFFGDLAQDREDRVSGVVLKQLGERAGIKPESIRVALHRLRRDGWLESERTGRSSSYFLTERGRQESADASPRIYAREGASRQNWTLLIAQPGSAQADTLSAMAGKKLELLAIGNHIALVGDMSGIDTTGMVSLSGPDLSIPDWLKNRLVEDDLATACDQLLETLRKLVRTIPASGTLDALETATLRTLIVHGWRRIRLRQPDLPDRFFPAHWSGAECRGLVMDLLDVLPRPDLATLEAVAEGERSGG